MKLRYEQINMNNIRIAAKVQFQIFPNSCAYIKYLKQIEKTEEFLIDFLVYENNNPIGVVGLYEKPEYNDTIWLSWFGVLEKYRYQGYGKQIFKDLIKIAKNYNRKFLRLTTYEVWNSEAQSFYKKHMQLEEYYTNPFDSQFDIKVGKSKIFSYSLCDEKVSYWNNKFIDIAEDDRIHELGIELLKRDGII